jgi:hypothetical protein
MYATASFPIFAVLLQISPVLRLIYNLFLGLCHFAQHFILLLLIFCYHVWFLPTETI